MITKEQTLKYGIPDIITCIDAGDLRPCVLINAGSLIDARGSEARVLINAGGVY